MDEDWSDDYIGSFSEACDHEGARIAGCEDEEELEGFFTLPKRTATLVGIPRQDEKLHFVPLDEMKTPCPSRPPAPPRRRKVTSVTMPSVRVPETTYYDIDPVPLSRRRDRKITAPTMAAVMGMPSDHEFKAASHALEQAAAYDALRDALLAFPDWVPVSQPMMAVMQEAKRFRQIAAQLLHVDPIELED